MWNFSAKWPWFSEALHSNQLVSLKLHRVTPFTNPWPTVWKATGSVALQSLERERVERFELMQLCWVYCSFHEETKARCRHNGNTSYEFCQKDDRKQKTFQDMDTPCLTLYSDWHLIYCRLDPWKWRANHYVSLLGRSVVFAFEDGSPRKLSSFIACLELMCGK